MLGRQFNCHPNATTERTTMSVIELSQFIALPLLDIIPVEPGSGGTNVVSRGSFDDYLQRAQSSTTGAGDSAASDSSRDAGQAQLSRAGESRSRAAPQPRPKKMETITTLSTARNLPGTPTFQRRIAGRRRTKTSRQNKTRSDLQPIRRKKTAKRTKATTAIPPRLRTIKTIDLTWE